MRKVEVEVGDELAAHLEEMARATGHSHGGYLADLLAEDAQKADYERQVERRVRKNAEEAADTMESLAERGRRSDG